MTILLLTTALPSRDGTGADIATQHFIRGLKKLGHAITVVGYKRVGDSQPYNEEQTLCVGSRHIEIKTAGYRPLFWCLRSFFRQLPFTSAQFYSRRYLNVVEMLVETHRYDLVIVDHSSQLFWLKSSIENHAHVAFLAHNVEHKIFTERIVDVSNKLLRWMYNREARLIKKIEDNLVSSGQKVWTLTETDAHYFSREGKSESVQVFSLPATEMQPFEFASFKAFDIGMIGSWLWKPNADSLDYFFDQIYPHLPPTMSISVAGRGAAWLKEKYSNVNYLGFVSNAKEFLLQSRVVAIPSIRGGGIQIKSLEAIGLGLQVVATPFAMRGINALPVTVQLAKSPVEFADYLIDAAKKIVTPDALRSVDEWVANRNIQFHNSLERNLRNIGNEKFPGRKK